jgi:coenzyme PQQ biosynthesis protein PqqD
MLDKKTKPLRNPAIKWRKESEKSILAPNMALNKIGTFIWELCNGKNTLENIITKIKKTFKAENEDIEKDVIEFLLNLYDNKLITWKN